MWKDAPLSVGGEKNKRCRGGGVIQKKKNWETGGDGEAARALLQRRQCRQHHAVTNRVVLHVYMYTSHSASDAACTCKHVHVVAAACTVRNAK